MKVGRATVIRRCMRMRCPNCNQAPLLRSWFHLYPECPLCKRSHDKESGFTLGTTSLGYVLALLLVLAPIIFAAVQGIISLPWALVLGGLGSLLLPILLYPFLLCWVVASYYGFLPGELPLNQEAEGAEN